MIAAVGALGFLFHDSIVQLYIWAGCLGIGFGSMLPTCSGILAENFDEQERGGIMGIQSVFTNIGAMYLTYVGGALAAIHWKFNYLVYFIALIPLIMGMLFIPKSKVEAAQTGEGSKIKLSSLSKETWMYGAFTFLFMLCYGVHSANIAFFIVEKNLGSPAVIGTVMAICTIGGMVGGATFKYATKFADTYTFSIAYIILIAGLLLTVFSNGLTMVYIGAVLVGISISWTIPQCMLSLTNCNAVAAATVACSVGHIGGQVGTFCSSIVMTSITGLFSSSTVFRYIFTACVCAVLAIIEGIIVKVMKAKRQNWPDADPVPFMPALAAGMRGNLKTMRVNFITRKQDCT